jgi:hypothetical protein
VRAVRGGAIVALLYFSMAFGKVTVTTLNACGSFISLRLMNEQRSVKIAECKSADKP